MEFVFGYSRLDKESEMYKDVSRFLCIFNGNIRQRDLWHHCSYSLTYFFSKSAVLDIAGSGHRWFCR